MLFGQNSNPHGLEFWRFCRTVDAQASFSVDLEVLTIDPMGIGVASVMK
jgi:hypothetical protein